jgi:hypothetical protein
MSRDGAASQAIASRGSPATPRSLKFLNPWHLICPWITSQHHSRKYARREEQMSSLSKRTLCSSCWSRPFLWPESAKQCKVSRLFLWRGDALSPTLASKVCPLLDPAHVSYSPWREWLPAWTLARIAGHSSISISQRYVHPAEDAVLNALARLGWAKFWAER